MPNQKKSDACCESHPLRPDGFRVESLVTVDERGQMVLPKDVRNRMGIEAGDKLAIIACEQDGECCCLCLMKGDELVHLVKERLGPVMKAMTA